MKKFYTRIIGVSFLFFLIGHIARTQTLWPGDVNNNGKVSGVDVLFAGVAYGSSGEPRTNATGDWQPQDVTMAWFQDFIGGTNYAYADADGDGFVGDNDIFGTIDKNFEKTHTPFSFEGYVNSSQDFHPSVEFKPVFDTVAYGTYAEFEINIGDSNVPVDEFYGISFLFSYSSDVTENSNALKMTMNPNSWIDPTDGGESRIFVKESSQPGKAEVTITRINQTTVSGSGNVANFFILIEDVGGFLPATDTLIVDIDSVIIIKNTSLEIQPARTSSAMVVVSNNSMNNPTPNCPNVVDPVCGSNGVTYLNSCWAEADGIYVYTSGTCFSDCINPNNMTSNAGCPTIYDPVCGCNGVTYINSCYADAAGVNYYSSDKCPDDTCFDPEIVVSSGNTTVNPDDGIITMSCPPDSNTPVCGCDGLTYPSACVAEASGISFYTAGDCGICVDPWLMNPDTICAYNYDPVCGCNGVTYMNECLAVSAGVTNYTNGPCSGGSFWCNSATPIQCGDFLPFETTIGEANKISSYPGCLGTALVGPDKVYVIHKNTPGDLQIGLEITTPGLDLDLFLLSDNCVNVECLASSHTSNSLTNNEGILYENAPIGTYYIVVDGQFTASAGNFRLEVSCGYLSCSGAPALECGVPYQGTNWGGNDDVSLYKCGNILNVENNGPEVVHTFTITEPGEVDINLTGLTANLELFLLSDCDAQSCLKFSQNGGTSDEHINRWLNAGTYYVVVDGYNGAVSDYELTVSCLGGCDFDMNLTASNASCGNSDGSITATSSGGTAPFWVSWDGPISGSFTTYSNSCSIYNLPPGTYWVTKTDVNGCSITEEITIYDGGNLNAQTTLIPASCSNMGMGKLMVSITSGSPNYHVILTGPTTKNFYTGSSNFTLTSLLPGNYTLYIVDNDGCAYTENFVVDNNNGLDFTVDVTHASCGGSGSITINLTNGVAPFWVILGGPVSNSYFTYNNSITIPNLPGGVYQIFVEDANWCQGHKTVTIQTNVLDVNATVYNGVCGQLGSVGLHMNNGSAPYQINWNGPVSGSATSFGSYYNIQNLPSGTYSINITDSAGCSDYQLVTIDNSANGLILDITPGHGQCGGLGFIWIDVYNGSAPYTVTWSGVNSGSFVSPTSGIDITNLPSDCYYVEITDANGCSATELVCVQNEPGLIFDANANNGNCGQNGSVSLSFFSGTPVYLISWTGPTSGNASTSANNYQINNLPPGNYTISVTDAAGCSESEYVTVGNGGNMTLSVNPQPAACGSLGNIEVWISGGTGPYAVSWSGPVFGSTNSNSGGVTIPNLPSGTYTISVFDSGNCYAMKTVVLANGTGGITVNATPNNSTCNPFGSISVNVSGTAFPMTVSWTGPSSGVTTIFTNNVTIPNLPGGAYTISVIDNAGCTASDNVWLTTGNGLDVWVIPNNGVCGQLGTIDLEINGGNGPFAITWAGPVNGFDTSNSNFYTIWDLPSGTYSITILDSNNCQTTKTVTITNGSSINLNTFPISGTCGQNGSVLVEIWGGVGPFEVQWSGPVTGWDSSNTNIYDITNLPTGVYTITVTDATGCSEIEGVSLVNTNNFSVNAITNPGVCGQLGTIAVEIWGGNAPYQISWTGPVSGSASSSLNPYTIWDLPSGTYTITVIDSDGCQDSETVTLTNGNPFNLNLAANPGACGQFGTVNVEIWGSTPPNQISWTGPVTGSTSSSDNLVTIWDLPTGTYWVTVIDNAGCEVSESIYLDNGTTFSVNTNPIPGSCGDYGMINVEIWGSNAPNLISWNGPVSGSTSIINNNYTVSGLPSGVYTISVTDAFGCSTSVTSTLNNGTPAELWANPTNGACGQDGSIALSLTNAATPIAVNWNGPVSNSTTITNNNYTIWDLPSGTYSIQIIDNNGCSDSKTVTIQNGNNIGVTATVNNGSCGQLGSINVNISGSTGQTTVAWSGPSSGSTTINNSVYLIPSLPSGNYSISITDSNGCTATQGVTLTNGTNLDISAQPNNGVCGQNGSIYLSISNGSVPFSVTWNGPTSGSMNINTFDFTIPNLPSGNYTINVSDNIGCAASSTIWVSVSSSPSATITAQNIPCAGSNTGSATAHVDIGTGTAPFTYLWNTGQTTQSISDLGVGTYFVTVTDINNCTSIASVNISATDPVFLDVISTNVDCAGGNTGSIFVTGWGGTPNFTYQWSNGVTFTELTPNSGSTISNLTAGTYGITATDVNGCSVTGSIDITEPLPLTIQTSVVNANCNSPTGSATATPDGGTAPYQYLWSNGHDGATISNVMPGIYTLTITDDRFCQEFATVMIGTDDQVPVAQFSNTINLLSVDFLDISTGNPVSFVWDFGDGSTSTQQNPSYEYCEPGDYDVCLTVTNACGSHQYCQTITVTIPSWAVILDVGESMGVAGSTVAVPITVENLSNIVSLAGSLQLSDPFVGTITGLVPGAITPTYGAASNTFSFFEPTGNGVSLNDGDILFYVAIDLIGNPGDEADLIIWDTPVAVEVGGIVNGIPTILQHVHLKGKVIIPHTAIANGAIVTFEDEPIGKANVNIFNNQYNDNQITGADGLYQFNDVPYGMEYIIEPTKDTFPGNGLSTFSLFVGQQFVLGLDPNALWSPYQVIAGDANCNGSFTTFDLFLIQQLILGMEDKFSDCPSWVFVPEEHIFPTPFNAHNVFPYPTADTLIVTSDTTVNFIGVKKGDILGNADPQNLNTPNSDDRDDSLLRLVTQNVQAEVGESVELTFTSNNFEEIVAIQMALTLESDKLQFEEFIGNALNTAAVGNPSDNELRISWFDLSGTSVTLDSAVILFTLKFTATQDFDNISDIIEIGSVNFQTEAHNMGGDILDIELIFEDPISSDNEQFKSQFNLYQNVPNPFENATVINFELPNRAKAEIEIQNAVGETIEVIKGEYAGGKNSVLWEHPNLSSGIYFYTLKSGNYHMTGKMIKI